MFRDPCCCDRVYLESWHGHVTLIFGSAQTANSKVPGGPGLEKIKMSRGGNTNGILRSVLSRPVLSRSGISGIVAWTRHTIIRFRPKCKLENPRGPGLEEITMSRGGNTNGILWSVLSRPVLLRSGISGIVAWTRHTKIRFRPNANSKISRGPGSKEIKMSRGGNTIGISRPARLRSAKMQCLD